MKLSVLACISAFALWSVSAFAAEPEGPTPQLLSNGDVLIENLGSSIASRLKVVSLSTNANYRVVCQVFYCDENLSTDDDEVAMKDKYVNLALTMYLGNVCEDLSPDELVDEYRSGLMSLYLDDFRLYVNEDLADLGIDVVAVSMRAVGEFAQRVAE